MANSNSLVVALVREAGLLKKRFPTGHTKLRQGTLRWTCKLQPSEISQNYRIHLTYAPPSPPRVVVGTLGRYQIPAGTCRTSIRTAAFVCTNPASGVMETRWHRQSFHGLANGFFSMSSGSPWACGLAPAATITGRSMRRVPHPVERLGNGVAERADKNLHHPDRALISRPADGQTQTRPPKGKWRPPPGSRRNRRQTGIC